jgi:hypothetical protein
MTSWLDVGLDVLQAVVGRLAPDHCWGAEAGQLADVLARLGGRLEYLARSIDAGIGKPSHRRHSRLLAEPTGECSSGRMRAFGECVEVISKCDVFEHPVAKWTELVAGRLRAQSFDELRLAAPRACATRRALGTLVETVASTCS